MTHAAHTVTTRLESSSRCRRCWGRHAMYRLVHGPRGTGANLRICRKKSQIRGPSGLPSPERPPAQNGRRQDLEWRVPRSCDEELICRNVSALRNTDQSSRRAPPKRVDGGHGGGGAWWSTFAWPQRRRCLCMCTDHARRARQLLASSFEPPSYLPTLTTITCACRGACSCCLQ